jgi:hypothetical protein
LRECPAMRMPLGLDLGSSYISPCTSAALTWPEKKIKKINKASSLKPSSGWARPIKYRKKIFS